MPVPTQKLPAAHSPPREFLSLVSRKAQDSLDHPRRCPGASFRDHYMGSQNTSDTVAASVELYSIFSGFIIFPFLYQRVLTPMHHTFEAEKSIKPKGSA